MRDFWLFFLPTIGNQHISNGLQPILQAEIQHNTNLNVGHYNYVTIQTFHTYFCFLGQGRFNQIILVFVGMFSTYFTTVEKVNWTIPSTATSCHGRQRRTRMWLYLSVVCGSTNPVKTCQNLEVCSTHVTVRRKILLWHRISNHLVAWQQKKEKSSSVDKSILLTCYMYYSRRKQIYSMFIYFLKTQNMVSICTLSNIWHLTNLNYHTGEKN